MGNINKNRQLNGTNNNLYLSLNTLQFFQDEHITGNICIIAEKEMPISKLVIGLVSYNLYQFGNAQGDKKAETEVVYQVIKINLFEGLGLPQSDFERVVVEKGKYYFPFSIPLSTKIPPSFEYVNQKDKAFIRYYLICNLTGRQSINIFQPIVIKAIPLVYDNPLKITSSKNMNMLFFNKGFVDLHCSYKKNAFSFDEPINIDVEIDNSLGELKIAGFYVKSIMAVDFKQKDSNKVIRHLEQDLKKINYNFVVNPGEKRQIQTLLKGMFYQTNFSADEIAKHYTIIKPDFFILPSTKSLFVNCYYFIKIKLLFSSFFADSNSHIVLMPAYISHIKLEDLGKKEEKKEEEKNSNNLNSGNALPELINEFEIIDFLQDDSNYKIADNSSNNDWKGEANPELLNNNDNGNALVEEEINLDSCEEYDGFCVIETPTKKQD